MAYGVFRALGTLKQIQIMVPIQALEKILAPILCRPKPQDVYEPGMADRVTRIGKMRIISDGTPQGTKVLTKDGVMVDGVTRVEISIDADGFTAVTLYVIPRYVDIVFEKENVSVIKDTERPKKVI